ncbi:hypothetical protein MTBLM5_240012 [Magnetospirillum sp. LM-5]|nr:hypothetical protein MTBLM5_240012 [Magnetospirillum sp. LM-5]
MSIVRNCCGSNHLIGPQNEHRSSCHKQINKEHMIAHVYFIARLATRALPRALLLCGPTAARSLHEDI